MILPQNITAHTIKALYCCNIFNYDIEKILNHIAQFNHEMKRIDTFYSKFAWLINSYYISPKFCNIFLIIIVRDIAHSYFDISIIISDIAIRNSEISINKIYLSLIKLVSVISKISFAIELNIKIDIANSYSDITQYIKRDITNSDIFLMQWYHQLCYRYLLKLGISYFLKLKLVFITWWLQISLILNNDISD